MTVSTIFSCDYCGEHMKNGEGWARVRTDGWGIDLKDGSRMEFGWTRHYHACYVGRATARSWTRSSWPRISGRRSETIPTISGQAVAARRRKHRKGDES